MNRIGKTRLLWIVLSLKIVVILSVGVVLAFHNVSRDITGEDRLYVSKILESAGYSGVSEKPESFSEQIDAILAVQDAVLRTTPVQKKIPPKRTREPKDLFLSDHAQCSDRARVIDKALRIQGFQTRYAAIFEAQDSGDLMAVFDSKARSHALVEVLTNKGWMMVDTNDRWVSLDSNDAPVSLAEWRTVEDKGGFLWSSRVHGAIYPLAHIRLRALQPPREFLSSL